MISSELKDLKEDIIRMSKQERKIKKPDKIVEIVKEILKFNKKKKKTIRKRHKNINTKPNA